MNINGRMKVKTLKSEFRKEFGLSIRIYEGKKFALDEATLASIRKNDSKGGEFAPQRNTKIGNLEDKIFDIFGIKTQISGSDDSYLCKNELTLKSALEFDEEKMRNKEKKLHTSTLENEYLVEESINENNNTENRADITITWETEDLKRYEVIENGEFVIDYSYDFSEDDKWKSIYALSQDEKFLSALLKHAELPKMENNELLLTDLYISKIEINGDIYATLDTEEWDDRFLIRLEDGTLECIS